MLTPDKVTPRGGRKTAKPALVYGANILCAAESDARAAAVTAQREGQDGRILLGATAGWQKTAN